MADQTLGDLYKAKAITPDDLTAAVDAYMADSSTGAHRLGGYSLDLAAAVLASTHATGILARSDVGDRSKRDAVRSALLIRTPTPVKP